MALNFITGGKKRAADEKFVTDVLLMKMGLVTKTIFLCGGREAREDTRAYWKNYAEACGLDYCVAGPVVYVGKFQGV